MSSWVQKLLISACTTFVFTQTAIAQTSQLEQAFKSISLLDNFETFDRQQMIDILEWKDNPRISEELGDVTMTIYGNADPREQFLAILANIPASLLYKEIRDERDKITRFYTETDKQGNGYFLFTFVGWGSNDTVAMLYKGCDEATYKKLIDE